MKLFNNQPDAHEYFKQAILNDENEFSPKHKITEPIKKRIAAYVNSQI